MRLNLKHIHRVRRRLADGSFREHFYHRLTRKPITGEPGSKEFLDSYRQAAAPEVRATRQLRDLVVHYQASPEFRGLAPATRRDYQRYLDRLVQHFGDMPIKALNDRRIRGDFLAWRDDLAKTSARGADMQIVVTQALLSWTHNRGLIEHNHLAKPGRVYKGNRAEMIWRDEDIDAFMQVAPAELQHAMVLALETGQRQGDLLRLSWSAYDGRSIALRQQKTGRPVSFPVTARLKRMLDSMPRRATTVLTTSRGSPWKADHFRHSWAEACQAAGINGLHFHDLRGTAITRLSEAGCTPQEIATISGHSLQSIAAILDVYSARTPSLATTAVQKLEAATSKRRRHGE